MDMVAALVEELAGGSAELSPRRFAFPEIPGSGA